MAGTGNKYDNKMSLNIFNYSASLVSTQNRVESPFIIVTIGDYTFGHCRKIEERNKLSTTYHITFPNFMKEINITKVNGTVNVYTIHMLYAIREGDDPNLLDKVFSSVSKSRQIKISYGDWNAPAYIYKEESALITKVSTRVQFDRSQIEYTVECTSNAISLTAGTQKFSGRHAKPSDIIKELIDKNICGIKTLFKGMADSSVISSNYMIADDDLVVDIPAKESINVLDYISYLVDYMVCNTDTPGRTTKNNVYYWYVCDDINNVYGGPYFKVVKVKANTKEYTEYNTYTVDLGYPSANYVSSFLVKNDDSWALLYNYAQKVKLPEYSYSIDDDGKLVQSYSPQLTNSNKYYITTESDRTWWSKMTLFPIQASITIKGLLRPSILMSYVKLNVYFYGKKSTSSGLYIITKQNDTINESGYKTTLELTRVGEDTDIDVL